LPSFRFDRTFDTARNVKALLNPQSRALRSKRRELIRVREEIHNAKDRQERLERNKRKKTLEQEIFQLENELRAVEDEQTGALPDFVIIGGKKCGTTLLYHLIGQHPLVQPAASKELHFFDRYFDEGTEWYRRCFPKPRWEDGRRTITGEATPYITNHRAPKRMAEVVPEARLIALLRNPVDRAYSDYHLVARKGREPRSFEEVVGLEGDEISEGGENRAGSFDDNSMYFSRGVYVDQLLRWVEFYDKEQLLVLKSEDFFESPLVTLKVVLDFLDLPALEGEASEIIPNKRNEGHYEQEMDPATRRRLEEYFEPHNQRLYDFLGTDFGW
jgi:hypothetical protein